MKTCCHTLGLTVQLLESRLKVCQTDNERCRVENEQLREMLDVRELEIDRLGNLFAGQTLENQ